MRRLVSAHVTAMLKERDTRGLPLTDDQVYLIVLGHYGITCPHPRYEVPTMCDAPQWRDLWRVRDGMGEAAMKSQDAGVDLCRGAGDVTEPGRSTPRASTPVGSCSTISENATSRAAFGSDVSTNSSR